MAFKTFIATCVLIGAASMAQAQTAPMNGQEFVAAAASSDMFEIKSSEMALKASTNKDVKAFAKQMIADHSKASKGLKAAAKAERIDVPTAPAEKQQAMLASLEGKKGAEFDGVYVDEQRKAHDEAVAMFSAYAESGDQPKLKAFAAKTLPTIKKHQEHVKGLSPGAM